MIIGTEHPDYSHIYRQWLRECGERVTWNGNRYAVIRDNGDIRFSLLGPDNPFDDYSNLRGIRGITTAGDKP
jgi:hypothetical protein